MAQLSAVIIALNEEKNMGDCLSALVFCDERVVVDSGSMDQTTAIARAHGAKVFSNTFVDFASQKNFGIEKATGGWVLLVDADERVSESLAREIQKIIQSPQFDGYFLRRSNQIFGRWMRYGDNGKDLQLRLVRKEKARLEGVVHERVYFNERTGILKGPFLHYSTENISSYMKKLNHYTRLDAQNAIGVGAIHELPLHRPLALFLYRFIWQRGFLDGIEGVFFCILSAYYEFLRQAKRWEIQTEANR